MKSTYTGPATVFRHDKNGHTFYSVAVSRKDAQGETQFAYKLVQFKKGVDIADRAKIDIHNAWETFYKNKDGEDVFYVFISDFTMQDGSAAGYQQPPQYQPPQYQRTPQQMQQAARTAYAASAPNRQPVHDTFEQIDDDVPF